MPDQPFVAVADGSGYALARASGEVLWPLDGKNVCPMPAKAALWLSTTTPKAARDLLGWAKLPGGEERSDGTCGAEKYLPTLLTPPVTGVY